MSDRVGLKPVTHQLLTSNYTEVFQYNEVFNAPHDFIVAKADRDTFDVNEEDKLAHIHFQEGPIKENGVNGVCNEDLIAMVITRLESFQKSPYACRENALAITKLEEAMLWLRARTMKRQAQGKEGTSQI